jgi:FKBP-type peptidyl-prolyl cis-trans isomerase FkpA
MTHFLRKTLIATALAGAVSLSGAAFAQAPAAKPAAAPAAAKSGIDAKFKTDKEKYGYVVGERVAKNLIQIKDDIDIPTFIAALQGAMKGEKSKLTDAELAEGDREFFTKVIQPKQQKLQAEQTAKMAEEGKKNQADGDAFLAKNGARAGVKTTASGLQYEVVKAGTGPKPKDTDTVKVEYKGTKIDGTVFDATEQHNPPGPITFPLKGVIPGWTEGLQLMPVGSTYKFYIPAKLAYGENGSGPIGPNSTLVFDVTLLGIEAAKAEQPAAKQ